MSEREFDTMLHKQRMYAVQFANKEITFEEYTIYTQKSNLQMFGMIVQEILVIRKTLNELSDSKRYG